MAGAVTNELIYEVLKQIQADTAALKAGQADHSRQFVDLRKQVNGVQAEILRVEEKIISMDLRLDRIEKRLNLVEA